MRHDNRGMSLVELILALTMATVVMGAATIFLRTALNTFNLADAHIDVQKEAQMNVEQIGTWIMQGNRIAAGEVTVVSSDSAVSGDETPSLTEPSLTVTYNSVDSSILVVFDEPVNERAGTYSARIIENAGGTAYGLDYSDDDTDVKVFWLGDDGKIYMLHMYTDTSYDDSGIVSNIAINGAGTGAFSVTRFSGYEDAVSFLKLASSYTHDNLRDYEDDEHIMADYAVGFSASLINSLDTNNHITGSIVSVSISFKEEDVTYTVSDQYAIRNVLR